MQGGYYKTKRILVFVNGRDQYKAFNIHPKCRQGWNALLDLFSKALKPYFGAIRVLRTKDGKKIIECFEELEHEGKYVACGFEPFKLIKRGYRTNSEINIKSKSTEYYPTEILSIDDQKKYPCLIETMRKGRTIIYVFANGKKTPPKKIVLIKSDYKNWSNILTHIGNILDIPEGVRGMYTVFGQPLCSPYEIQHGGYYVAIPFNAYFKQIKYLPIAKLESYYECSPMVTKEVYVSAAKSCPSDDGFGKKRRRQKTTRTKRVPEGFNSFPNPTDKVQLHVRIDGSSIKKKKTKCVCTGGTICDTVRKKRPTGFTPPSDLVFTESDSLELRTLDERCTVDSINHGYITHLKEEDITEPLVDINVNDTLKNDFTQTSAVFFEAKYDKDNAILLNEKKYFLIPEENLRNLDGDFGKNWYTELVDSALEKRDKHIYEEVKNLASKFVGVIIKASEKVANISIFGNEGLSDNYTVESINSDNIIGKASVISATLGPKYRSSFRNSQQEVLKKTSMVKEGQAPQTSKDKFLRLAVPIGRDSIVEGDMIPKNISTEKHADGSQLVKKASDSVIHKLNKDYSPLTPTRNADKSREYRTSDTAGAATFSTLKRDSIGYALRMNSKQKMSETNEKRRRSKGDDIQIDEQEDMGIQQYGEAIDEAPFIANIVEPLAQAIKSPKGDLTETLGVLRDLQPLGETYEESDEENEYLSSVKDSFDETDDSEYEDIGEDETSDLDTTTTPNTSTISDSEENVDEDELRTLNAEENDETDDESVGDQFETTDIMNIDGEPFREKYSVEKFEARENIDDFEVLESSSEVSPLESKRSASIKKLSSSMKTERRDGNASKEDLPTPKRTISDKNAIEKFLPTDGIETEEVKQFLPGEADLDPNVSSSNEVINEKFLSSEILAKTEEQKEDLSDEEEPKTHKSSSEISQLDSKRSASIKRLSSITRSGNSSTDGLFTPKRTISNKDAVQQLLPENEPDSEKAESFPTKYASPNRISSTSKRVTIEDIFANDKLSKAIEEKGDLADGDEIRDLKSSSGVSPLDSKRSSSLKRFSSGTKSVGAENSLFENDSPSPKRTISNKDTVEKFLPSIEDAHVDTKNSSPEARPLYSKEPTLKEHIEKRLSNNKLFQITEENRDFLNEGALLVPSFKVSKQENIKKSLPSLDRVNAKDESTVAKRLSSKKDNIGHFTSSKEFNSEETKVLTLDNVTSSPKRSTSNRDLQRMYQLSKEFNEVAENHKNPPASTERSIFDGSYGSAGKIGEKKHISPKDSFIIAKRTFSSKDKFKDGGTDNKSNVKEEIAFALERVLSPLDEDTTRKIPSNILVEKANSHSIEVASIPERTISNNDRIEKFVADYQEEKETSPTPKRTISNTDKWKTFFPSQEKRIDEEGASEAVESSMPPKRSLSNKDTLKRLSSQTKSDRESYEFRGSRRNTYDNSEIDYDYLVGDPRFSYFLEKSPEEQPKRSVQSEQSGTDPAEYYKPREGMRERIDAFYAAQKFSGNRLNNNAKLETDNENIRSSFEERKSLMYDLKNQLESALNRKLN